jgi:hypothetical protein
MNKARSAHPALAIRLPATENGIGGRGIVAKTTTKKRVRWFRGSNAEACEHVHINPSIHKNDFADFNLLKPFDWHEGTFEFPEESVTAHLCDGCVAGLKKQTIEFVLVKVVDTLIAGVIGTEHWGVDEQGYVYALDENGYPANEAPEPTATKVRDAIQKSKAATARDGSFRRKSDRLAAAHRKLDWFVTTGGDLKAAEAVPIRQEFENAFKELCDEFGPVAGGVVNCPRCGNPVSVGVPTL